MLQKSMLLVSNAHLTYRIFGRCLYTSVTGSRKGIQWKGSQRNLSSSVSFDELPDQHSKGKSMKHQYAIATTDTAFKHMLSLSMGSDSSIVISLLNCFIPAFRGDPIVEVDEAPTAVPAIKRIGEKQTFMDLHVVSSRGTHYIIEMQARRHTMFDERVLFYACQVSERELCAEGWYLHLKPVIALHVLDYDTNRVRGLKSSVPDSLVDRVNGKHMGDDQFMKHYLLKDQQSGQEIDYLQMIQIELPRAEKRRKLFPPQSDFKPQDWWLSILRYGHLYTLADVNSFTLRRKSCLKRSIKH